MATDYITLTELSKISRRHLQYLNKLIALGILPEGKKTWRTRYVPKQSCLAVLSKIPRRPGWTTDKNGIRITNT